MIVYGIPNCDTVKKARQWLTSHGQAHEFHDFKKLGVPPAQLARWMDTLGWEKIVNRQGTTWRKLDAAAQAAVHDAASAADLLLREPSAIKRPVVEWADGAITVGFAPDAWSQRLG